MIIAVFGVFKLVATDVDKVDKFAVVYLCTKGYNYLAEKIRVQNDDKNNTFIART